jgi:ABC-type multidrug transport system permease subunit
MNDDDDDEDDDNGQDASAKWLNGVSQSIQFRSPYSFAILFLFLFCFGFLFDSRRETIHTIEQQEII